MLCGVNGIGKTNILEALTLLGRNASLRGSDFEEMIALNPKRSERNFTIYTEISDHEFIEKIGISFDGIAKKKVLRLMAKL